MVKLILNIIFSFGLLLSVQSQSGVIEGIVRDKKAGEVLIGANIIVQGTGNGTITNLNGEFRLINIEPGAVDLYISYISYEPLIIDGIKVEKGKPANVIVELEESGVQLEAVEITARRVPYSEITLLNTIRTSQMVVSGISAQQISRSQDSDAAEVVRRIPGVTIVNDRFIVVRGLSERYNTVMLHGVLAPSMEADVKSFSFDIIPSSQIEKILVYKSPSADLPGEFAGGLIKIFTKSIPDNSGIEVSYSNNYRSGTTFNNFPTQEKGKNAWTGFNTSYFDLPVDFPEDLRTITSQPDRLQEAGRSLRNNWVPITQNAWLDQNFSLTGNALFKIKNIQVGQITSINYNNSTSILNYERNDFNAYDFVNEKSLPLYNFNDIQTNTGTRLGLLHNYGIKINKNHSLEIVNLFNQNANYKYTNRTGPHQDFGFYFDNHSFQQIFRGLFSGHINGNHQFNTGTKLNWSAGLGTSNRDMPDYKQYRSEKPLNDPEDQFYTYIPIGGAQPYFMGRFHSNMKERSNTYSANISHTFNFSKDGWFKPSIQAGFFREYKERDFKARNIGYTQSPGFIQSLREVSIDSLFRIENINNYGGIKIDEQSNPQDSYDASNVLSAYYAMANIPVTPGFRVIMGVRVENNLRLLNSATTAGPVNVNFRDTDILPSVNASYNFTDRMLVRLAYGKTLNRPEFRENAPFGFFDFDFNYVVTGYPHLLSAKIENYDLRWEFYPSHSEIISLGAFYKDFSNAIEKVFLPGAGSGGSKNFSYGNSEKSQVYGIELDLRKSLAETPVGFFNNLTIALNAALMKSSVEIGKGTRSQGRDTDPRPLQGQSPYIINLGLYYNNVDSDIQVNLMYNLIGRRIYSAGFTELDKSFVSYPDIFEMPRNLLDITISKRFNKNLTFKAGISDIFNQKSYFLQDANQTGKLKSSEDQVIRSFKPGTNFSGGFTVKF